MLRIIKILFDKTFANHSPSKNRIIKGKDARKLIYDYYKDEEEYK